MRREERKKISERKGGSRRKEGRSGRKFSGMGEKERDQRGNGSKREGETAIGNVRGEGDDSNKRASRLRGKNLHE